MACSSRQRLSNSSDSDDVEEPQILKKRKRSYAQNYQPTWEQDDRFKGWLSKSKKGTTYCYCKACNKDFICGKSEIEKNAKGVARQQTLTDMPTLQQRTAIQRKVKEAEIRLATFAVVHNIAFNSLNQLDHLAKLKPRNLFRL